MRGEPKKRWSGGQSGSATHSERAYIAKVQRARAAGESAAADPGASERSCPSRYDEDERSYWLAAFRRGRRG